jgi:D-alanyl-D-alanine carboxypeptidase
MPLTFQEPEVLGPRYQAPDAPHFDLGDTIKAAFETQNTVGSALASQAPSFTMPSEQQVSEYDPFQDIKGYEPYADHFILARSPEDTQRIKADIDREQQNRNILSASGWKGMVAQIAAGTLDPVFLPLLAIPGGSEVKALRAAQALKVVAPEATAALPAEAAKEVSTMALAGKFALFGGGAATVSETALNATQETRTKLESAFNITGATLLSGVLGAAAGYLTRSQFNALAKGIETDFVDRSISAAELHPTTLPQETLAGSAGVARATKNVSPILRTMQSPSLATRQIVQDLAEQHTDEALGIPAK